MPTFISHQELSDLVKDKKIIGPLETVELEKFSLPWANAAKRCNTAAIKIAQKKGYDLVHGDGHSILYGLPDTIIAKYAFYKSA